MLGRNAEAANAYQRYLDDPEADPARVSEVGDVLATLDRVLGRISLRAAAPSAPTAPSLSSAPSAHLGSSNRRRDQGEEMKAPTCVRCKAIVLELEGQFEKLDSFYLGEGGPPPESAEYWHSRCLHESGYGLAWYEARMKNFVEVRRYSLVATVSPWSVVKGPRSKGALALSQRGDLISLYKPYGKIGTIEGGGVYRVEEDEFHLALEETDVIRTVQEALSSKGTFPVLSLFDALKVSDRTSHPQSLADSALSFDNSLQRYWTTVNVSARWSYGVFIPAQLEAYITRN